MGVLPLQFKAGEGANTLRLDRTGLFSTIGLSNELEPGQEVTVVAKKSDGNEIRFHTICRIDTPVEVEQYQNGGILQTVLRGFLRG